MGIESYSPHLKAVLAQLEDIEAVFNYDELPGTLLTFPCAVIQPVEGDQQMSAGGPNIAHDTIQVTVFVGGQVLSQALNQAVPYIGRMKKKIAANVTLNGSVWHCLPVPPPQKFWRGPGAIRYGEAEHQGITFLLDVKYQETLTVST